MPALNYKHLRYFHEVARTGSVARAAEQLHITPQTISGQIGLLEDSLGGPLLANVGRRVELTELGHIVKSYSEEIFALGRELEDTLRDRPSGRAVNLKVGVSDALPKYMAYHLLKPALKLPEALKLVCREGKLSSLLAELAIHRLDIVLADSPLPPTVNVRGYSHLLGECGVSFFGTEALVHRHKGAFPGCLDGAPMLLPGQDSTMRGQIEGWFERSGVRPVIVGEFDDGALMKAFGQAGVGFFPGPTAVAAPIRKQFDVRLVGSTTDLVERFYAISVQHRLTHPAVLAIRTAAQSELFGSKPAR